MKVRLTMDAAYRVFIVNNDWGTEVEVPEDLIKRFQEADEKFREVEKELCGLLDQALKCPR